MCLEKCLYSVEERRTYQPGTTLLCSTVQLWPTLDEMTSFALRIKLLH